MFASSLGSITGAGNTLGLRRVRRSIAVLVDGLGSQNLKAAGGHAPFLNQVAANGKPISCAFPSTTATSITSFGTGLAGGQHGLVGYKVYDRIAERSANLLTGWGEGQDALSWQPQQTVAQRAIEAGVEAFVIGPAAYADSGFTVATMRGAKYLAGKSISDRVDVALGLLGKTKTDFICYLYVPELDQIAHNSGVESDRWLAAIEDLDWQMRRLNAGLGKNDGLVITADHGVVDIARSNHIYLDEAPVAWESVVDVGGDPRVNYIYLRDPNGSGQQFAAALQSFVGDRALIVSRQQAIEAQWFGPDTTSQAISRMPEYFALATKNVALYHRGFAPAKSLDMIGQHGALSSKELSIPLVTLGGYATKR